MTIMLWALVPIAIAAFITYSYVKGGYWRGR